MLFSFARGRAGEKLARGCVSRYSFKCDYTLIQITHQEIELPARAANFFSAMARKARGALGQSFVMVEKSEKERSLFNIYLNCAWAKVQCASAMNANGTAIKAGCVTRQHRVVCCPDRPARLSRCKEGMARVFALRLQALLSSL